MTETTATLEPTTEAADETPAEVAPAEAPAKCQPSPKYFDLKNDGTR